jgi:hypothetical protein
MLSAKSKCWHLLKRYASRILRVLARPASIAAALSNGDDASLDLFARVGRGQPVNHYNDYGADGCFSILMKIGNH